MRASDAHVYLTVPFVLSWSLLDAMSTGCLIVASDTPPVREFMADGRTGLLCRRTIPRRWRRRSRRRSTPPRRCARFARGRGR